jgi:hypothetical protein
MRLSLTKREIKVTRDVLQRITAYTDDEMTDFLGWDDEDKASWSDALDKFTRADEESS